MQVKGVSCVEYVFDFGQIVWGKEDFDGGAGGEVDESISQGKVEEMVFPLANASWGLFLSFAREGWSGRDWGLHLTRARMHDRFVFVHVDHAIEVGKGW
jgi:hypothetical protein